jgi:diguanylate cyclase (GGDEF)-like protein/PAS domain S-box-containing protein
MQEVALIQHGPTAFLPGLAVTELQKARDELAESRRQFGSVLNSLAGIFYRCELNFPWRMSFVSEGIESLTGFTAQELECQNGWSELMRVEDRGAVETAVTEGIMEKCRFDVSYRITRKDGEVRWVSERGRAIYDERGNPLFLEGVIADISGQKVADQLQKTMITRWGRTLDAIPQMVWTMAGDGTEEFYNAQWFRFTGCRIGGTESMSRTDLIHSDDRPRVISLWREKFANGEPYEAQYRIRHVGGDYRWILSRGQPEYDAHGKLTRWYGTCTDIHQEVLGRQALEASEAVSRSMIEASPDCISLLDTDGNTSFLNRAAMEALELKSPAALLGQPWAFGLPPSFRGPAARAIAQAAAGRTGRFTATQPKPGGRRWWDIVVAPIQSESASLSGLICIARDITHQKTAEERIRWAANHDPLTQLPNRALFQRTLDRAIVEAKKSGGAITVLMMDLDHFKRTNDALGHDAGDALLNEFADRLRETVRAVDLVARIGGDEFAILLQGVAGEEEVEAAVESILTRLKTPCEFDGKLLDIRASIGASTFPTHGQTRTELLKHADIALYVAKRAGRGSLRIFHPVMQADSQKRLAMLGLARDAISDDAIVAAYQPKVDLRSGRLDGFEALLRWKHPTKGLQGPETIASAFDDGVLAAQISDRIIHCVIEDMRRWTEAGVDFGHVAINAGAAEFKRGNFADKLLERLGRAGLPTSCLQLEVTETVFLGRGAEHVEDTLRALSDAGIEIALDDFGTGYASLAHLNKFPVNIIKIDRSFIRDLATSSHDAAIVRAVIKLGRSLGIKIVAEGIETQQQSEFLRKLRCDTGQGYLFGKAVRPSLLPSLINNWAATRAAA